MKRDSRVASVRITVIDDNKEHCRLACEAIQSGHTRWTVVGHTGAREALSDQWLASSRVNVVICDQRLDNDVIKGIDVLLMLKRRHPDLYTILITGEELDVGVAALKAGIADFVMKRGDWPLALREAVERRVKLGGAEPRKPLCFAIMPYGGNFDAYYRKIWKEAAKKAGYEILRNDETPGSGVFLREVWKALGDSEVVLADLTGSNPNVMYEVGLAHGGKIRTILLVQDPRELPSDLQHVRCIVYRTEEPGWDRSLEENLVRALIRAPGSEDPQPW